MKVQKEFTTPPQVAKMFGVNVDKVRGWIESGELIAYNFSNGDRRRLHIHKDDLDAFMRQRMAVPQNERKPAKRRVLKQSSIEEFV